jgi:hypothetical protein
MHADDGAAVWKSWRSLSWPYCVIADLFQSGCGPPALLPVMLPVLLQLAPGLPLSPDGLPAVRRLTNVYHPYDPVAHRCVGRLGADHLALEHCGIDGIAG